MVKYSNRVGILNVIPMLPMVLPSMFVYSLPMAGLMATVSTISRARHRKETVSLAASGIGGTQLLAPFLIMGLLLNALTLISFQWLQPLGETYKDHYLANIGAKLLQSELNKPHATIELNDNTLSFFSQDGGARSAIIQNRQDGVIQREMFSENADIHIDPDNKQVELVTVGEVHVMSYGPESSGHLVYESFPTMRLPYREKYSNRRRVNLRTWTLTHMWHRIRHHAYDEMNKLKAYFFEKIALALSPFFLVLIGFQLGFLDRGNSRVTGLLSGLGILFLLFYPLLMMGKKIVLQGTDLPILWLQMPNLVLVALSAIGLTRLNRWI
jgi:lipopolysaccharide export system permease protein